MPENTFHEETPTQKITAKQNKKRLIIVGVFILILITGGLIYSSTAANKKVKLSPLTQTTQSSQSTTSPKSPTPFPFQELTIPYLRSRSYKSSLDILELVNSNEQYRTYTTSYSSDGFTIHGMVTQPAGEPPNGGWPAIVFVHGYIPPAQYQTLGSSYSSYVDYLARNGFVVFKIDLRGHGSSEGEAGGGYYGSDYIVDTLNAYSALQASSFVNPKKIGLWGHSMAGNVLLRTAAVKMNIPAVVIWAGAVYSYADMQKYGIKDASYTPPSNDSERQRKRKLLFDTYGQFSADSDFWKQVAPTNYLSDITSAIQIHHAVDDPVVDVGYSRDLNALLDKTTISHELNEYQSAGHNISGASFNEAMAKTVEFYNKYLEK